MRSAKLTQPLTRFASWTDEEGDKKTYFSMVALSGQPVAGFFETFVFDLKGVEFSKPRIGILNEHMRDSRIGFADETDKRVTKEGLVLKGQLLSNDEAQRVAQDAYEGFPLEASVGITWKDDDEEKPEAGDTCEVNGLTLTGPCTVIRKARLKETSICTLGRDDKTSTKILCLSSDVEGGNNTIPQQREGERAMTPEEFAAKNPQVVTAWKEEGSESERTRLLALYEALKDHDPEIVLKAIVQGKTLVEAQQEILAALKEKNDKLAEKLTQQAEMTSAGAPAPAPVGGTEDTSDKKDDKKADLNLSGKSYEEQAKIVWEAREDLHMEFLDFDNFKAYFMAEKKATDNGFEAHRILGGTTQIEV